MKIYYYQFVIAGTGVIIIHITIWYLHILKAFCGYAVAGYGCVQRCLTVAFIYRVSENMQTQRPQAER